MNQSPIESHRRKLINLFYLSDLLPLSNMNSSDRRTTKNANFFFSLFTPVLLGQRFNKAQRGYEISDPQHPLIPQENMKVLSKSSRGAFEPIPLLFLHDLISRQTHLTRIPQTEPGGEERIHQNEDEEALVLRFEQFFFFDYGGRKRASWRVDLPRFRRRGFPSAKGVATLRAWKGTPRLSTNRLRPLATPGRAIPRLGVLRREGDQRRRVLATPGTQRHRNERAINHARTPRAPTKSSPR